MKITGISFSPRKKGNSVILLEEALKGAEQEGAKTELLTTAGMNINGCDGCNSCLKTGECHIKDDVQIIHDKMIQANGIVFSTPIYFYGMTAQAKAVVDRTYSLSRPERSLRNKVGGLLVVAGSLGMIDAIKDFYFFFAIKRMLPANFVGAYAMDKGDIQKLQWV